LVCGKSRSFEEIKMKGTVFIANTIKNFIKRNSKAQESSYYSKKRNSRVKIKIININVYRGQTVLIRELVNTYLTELCSLTLKFKYMCS